MLLRRDGRVLLHLRQGTGYRDGHWATAAAGHVEQGEPVTAAACREAAEELGVVIEPAALEPLTTMHRTHRNGRPIDERVDFFFTCARWAGEPTVREPEQVRRPALVRPRRPARAVVPHERWVLERLRAGAVPPITTYGFGR